MVIGVLPWSLGCKQEGLVKYGVNAWAQARGRYPVPSIWYQVLGTKYLIPSTWYQVLGTKYLDFGPNLTKNRIFQNLTDSMSSGMENAQNFAAVIPSMVLGPSFF